MAKACLRLSIAQGPGDRGERTVSNLGAADIHNRALLFQIERDQFVRFGYPNGFGHARQILEMLQTDDALVACDANGGAVGPGHDMSPQAERFDHADDSGDLTLGGVGIHDDEHRRTSFFLCNGARCKPVSRCFHVPVGQFVAALLHSHFHLGLSLTQ